jgi:hypothetical protein
MGIFSRWLDDVAERQLAKDESGRMVFLPRGPRRSGCYVDAPDKDKIKSLVKMYFVASALINVTGSTASLAFTQALTFDRHSAPLESQLKFGLVVYAIAAIFFYIGPALVLWRTYLGALAGLCSTLTTVEPASMHLMKPPASRARAVSILVAVAMVLILFGLMLAVSYRR